MILEKSSKFMYNLRNGREDKNARRWTTFGFDNKINFPIYFLKLNFFSILKIKIVYLRPFLSFLTFPKLWKQNFMHFGHKYVET